MLEFQGAPEFSYKNVSSMSLFCVSSRDNTYAKNTLWFHAMALLPWGNQVSMIRAVSFCFSLKNLSSVDLPMRLDRILVLGILKIINNEVYVSFLKLFCFCCCVGWLFFSHLFLYLIHQSFILSIFFIWTWLQVFKRCLLASQAGIKANECSCTLLFNCHTCIPSYKILAEGTWW